MGNKNSNKFMHMIKFNFSTLILFELLHKGVALIILPAIEYIFNISMGISGMKYLTTDNIIKLLINPISMILIILILIVLSFYVFFEFISIILCLNKSMQCEKIGVIELIKISLNKAVVIFYPKNILLMIFVILIIPLTNIGLTSNVIGRLRLPEYIQDYIQSNYILNIIYLMLMIILYILVTKWIFSMHEMALSTNNFKEARKKSVRLTKDKSIKIIIASTGIITLTAVIEIFLYHFIIILIGLWTKYYTANYSNYNNDLKSIFINRYFVFNDYVKIISMVATFIINIGFISTLYYKYNGIEIKKVNIESSKKFRTKSLIKVALILFLIQINTIAFSSYGYNEFNTDFFYNTKATAHRASALIAPENTLAGIRESILSQAEYAEIDVQETKDGELIIIHDSNFKRTTGVDKNVWEVNYDEVKTYDAGSYFSSNFAGEKIPTLEEVMKYSKGKINLIIEIKLNGHEKGDIANKVIDLVKEYDFEKQCIIASMDKDILKKVKEIDSNLETCYLTALAYGDFYNLDYADAYGIESTFVNREVVNSIHNIGKKIFVWTINNQDLMKKMVDINVDSIITDNPYLVLDTIYWKKNSFVTLVAAKLFGN